MAVTIDKAEFSWSMEISQTLDGIDLGTPEDKIDTVWKTSLTDGTGDDQIEVSWHDRKIISAGSTVDLDFFGTSEQNAFGDDIAFTKIKAVLIKNQSGLVTAGHSVATLQIITVAVTVASSIADLDVPLDPDGVFLWVNPKTGIACSSGTDKWRMTNPAGAQAQYDIIIVGLI